MSAADFDPTAYRFFPDAEWDREIKCWVVKKTENWVVMVTPMIYNDRVLLSTNGEWRHSWTAGWCYDKGPAAMFAAQAFDPETQNDPVGFKKLAVDGRRTARQVAEINEKLQTR